MDECPALKGHARDIDNVLAKALPEAKHYASKKVCKSFAGPGRVGGGGVVFLVNHLVIMPLRKEKEKTDVKV